MDKYNYLLKLNETSTPDYIKNMVIYAENNQVPIIQKEALDFITHLIKISNTTKILEIGSAIGYSAISFALIRDNITVTSIERDEKMYFEAKKNVKLAALDKRIQLICADALSFDENSLDKDYDLLFIDAAKSKYQVFFEKYEKLVKKNGLIITDNVFFHDLLFSNEIKNRNTAQLVKKIKKYNEWLINNKTFDTKFFAVGDGLAVSIKIL